ncbi:MAG: hypothetical protein AAGI30_09140 [Planctomycetota bacterium]
MSATCLVQADLSAAVVLSPGGDRTPWAAPMTEAGRPGAIVIRERAVELASWLASRPEVRKKLDALVLDVDQSLCVWVRATSAAEPVVAATLASQREELAGKMPVQDVEVVHTAGRETQASGEAPHGRRRAASAEPVGVTTMWASHAPARLLIDRLDRLGVRVGAVRSLWHTMAGSESIAGGVRGWVAHLAIEEDRLVWAWGLDGRLRCGGVVRGDASARAESLAGRIVMDWLSWSASLDVRPDRLRILAEDESTARAVASSLEHRWGALDVSIDRATRPAEVAASRQLTPAAGSLASLERCPGRATRRAFQVLAAALVLGAIAVGGLSHRLHSGSSAWLSRAQDLRQQTIERLRAERSEIATDPFPVQRLRAIYAEITSEPPLALPPEPKPLYGAAGFVLSRLAQLDEARLQQLTLDGREGVEVRATVQDRREAILFVEQLNENAAAASEELGTLEWELANSNPRGDKELAFIKAEWP